MKKAVALVMITMMLLCGCSSEGTSTIVSNQNNAYYQQISMEEAMELFNSGIDYILLDVRTKEEYESGHIPGAICIPNEEIGIDRPDRLPNLEQMILVYCRSGNRSKEAAQKLANMGYANVIEFGGIIDYTGETYIGEGRDIGFSNDEELMVSDAIIANLDGIEVDVDDLVDGYLVVSITNKSPRDWYYDEEFHLYKTEDNRNWTELKWAEPKEWDTSLNRLATGQSTTVNYDLVGLEGLTAGSYKIGIKDIEVYFVLTWGEF